MTNEQMIRELRAVAEKYKGKHVFTCETNINLMATDAANRIESLCDEISRQKAEISVKRKLLEKAEAEFERLQKHNTEMARKHYQDGKTEAIKEFAEMIKANQGMLFNYIYSKPYFAKAIDTLVKEFTEGEKQ